MFYVPPFPFYCNRSRAFFLISKASTESDRQKDESRGSFQDRLEAWLPMRAASCQGPETSKAILVWSGLVPCTKNMVRSPTFRPLGAVMARKGARKLHAERCSWIMPSARECWVSLVIGQYPSDLGQRAAQRQRLGGKGPSISTFEAHHALTYPRCHEKCRLLIRAGASHTVVRDVRVRALLLSYS